MKLTFSERYLLGSLAQFGRRYDFDTASERTLVNTGLAERFCDPDGFGMIRLTDAGRAALEQEGK